MLQRSCRRLVFWSLIANIVSLGTPALSQVPQRESAAGEVDTSDAKQVFDFVLAGMKDQRYKLVSGVCRFEGTFLLANQDDPEKNLQGPLKGLMALDGGKVRYDITRPDFVVDPGSIQTLPESGRVTANRVRGVSTRMFADDETRVAGWHSDNPLLSISQSKDSKDRRASEYVDIRGITLYDALSINRGYSLDQVFDNLSSYVQEEVVVVDESTWILIRSHDSDEHWVTRFSLKVDTKSGFTPTHFKCERSLAKEIGKVDLRDREKIT